MELNKIYLGDCLEIMKNIKTCSVNMILCDLPYGHYTDCKWDIAIPFNKLWEQYERIITENGAIVLFGVEPFSSYLRMSNIKLYKYDWKWIKDKPTNFINCKNAPMRIHENISVFSKGMTANGSKKNMIYNPQGLIEVNRKGGIHVDNKDNMLGHRPSREKYKGGIQKYTNYPRDILEFSNKIKSRLLSVQKPESLYKYLIKTYTNEGNLILDNCCGSGTIKIAKTINRNYIGIEKDKIIFNIATERTFNSEAS